MPTVSFAGCADAVAPSAPSAVTRASASTNLVAIDPLLGVEPLLEVTCVDALGLGLRPRVVGVARAAQQVIDDAEVDKDLGWGATKRFERRQFLFRERQGRSIDVEAPLLFRRRRL